MPQNFVQKINKTRRCLQRRRIIAATYWAVALTITGALVLTGLDRALGMNDLAGRWLCSVTLALLCIAIGRRWFSAACRPPITLLEVAHRVERRYPRLRDMVTSAIDFSSQSPADPHAGSESLRRAVVLRAAQAVDEVDWRQLVPRRPLRHAALAVGGVLLVLAALAWWTPRALGTGFTRLINPLSTAAWPRDNDLKFVDPPTLLAAGDDFVVQLLDTRGPLPRTVEMHYRTWRDGRWHRQTQPLAATGKALEVRRPRVQESFQFRAIGGDHRNMPWHRLEVVAPPRVQALQVTVQPLAYTGLSAQPLTNNARVLTGSGLEVVGQTDQPLTRVVLSSKGGAVLSASLEGDGRKFLIAADAWSAKKSGVFWFELTTPTGLTTRSARKLPIEVAPDKPPWIKFIEPADDLTVVPEAEVRLILEAHDNLAVREIDLVYRRSDRSDEGDQALPLFRGPDRALPPNSHGAELSADDNAPRKRLIHVWQLGPLALKPGSVVEVLARASDYQPAMGQTARSIRLTVVSRRELLRRLGQREARILEKISQILQQQRQLRLRTEAWGNASERSAKHGVSEGHAVLFRQRQIADALVKRSDSVMRALEKVLDDFDRNQLVRPETQEQFESLHSLLSDLAEEPLPALEQLLSEWIRQAEYGSEQPRNAGALRRPKLAAAVAQRQDQVIDALQQALQRLASWNILQQFERELSALNNDQQQLWQTCRRDIAPGWLQSNSIAARLLAEDALKQAANQERSLARRLADWVAGMSQSADELSEHEPALSDRLATTTALAQKLAVQATLHEAADELQQLRLGQSMSLQQQALDQLQTLLAQLADRAQGKPDKHPGQRGNAQRQQPSTSKQNAQLPVGAGKAGSKPGTARSPTATHDADLSAGLAVAGQRIKALWGHLPERQRQRILQPLHEDFLPKYAAEIEDYFRALAEPEEEKDR